MTAAGCNTASELARKTGIGEAQISRWLRGQTTPDVPNLRRLSKPLRRPLLELLVAAGHVEPEEARMKDRPEPPPVPVGAGVDPELIAELAVADPAAVEAVRAVLRATKAT
jgi:transcriptional regulator with XRE-family HTH domain